MPTYDYVCDACDHAFEHFQGINDPLLEKCPACKKKKLRRLFGTGAALMFKGSGFYTTDYRSESYKKGVDAEKSSRKSESEGKSGEGKSAEKSNDKSSGEAKSESKSENKSESTSSTKSESSSPTKSERKSSSKPSGRKGKS